MDIIDRDIRDKELIKNHADQNVDNEANHFQDNANQTSKVYHSSNINVYQRLTSLRRQLRKISHLIAPT